MTESEGVRHTDNAYVPDLVAFLPEPLTISVEPLFTISTLYPEGSTCTQGRACQGKEGQHSRKVSSRAVSVQDESLFLERTRAKRSARLLEQRGRK